MVVLSVAINPAYYNASLSNWGKSGANPAYENKAVSTWDIYNNQDEESTISPYQYHSGNDSSTGLNVGLNNATSLNATTPSSSMSNYGSSATKDAAKAGFYGGLQNAGIALGAKGALGATLASIYGAPVMDVAMRSAFSGIPGAMSTVMGSTLNAALGIDTKNKSTLDTITSFAMPTALSAIPGIGPALGMGYGIFGGVIGNALSDAFDTRDEEATWDALEDEKGWLEAKQTKAEWDSLYGPQMAMSVQAALAAKDAVAAKGTQNELDLGISVAPAPGVGYLGYSTAASLGQSVGLDPGTAIGQANFSTNALGVNSVQQGPATSTQTSNLSALESSTRSSTTSNNTSSNSTLSALGEGNSLGDMGSSNDTSGGNSVVCSELIKQGRYNKATYRRAWSYIKKNKTTAQIRGYHWWGVPLVKKMRTGSKFYNFIGTLVGMYADELAYLDGANIKRTLTGRILNPIISIGCEVIGRLVKYDKVNKRWDRKDSERIQVEK